MDWSKALALPQGLRVTAGVLAWCRLRLEREVEGAYHERLQRQCYLEQIEKQRVSRWGGTTRAQAMKMPACKAYNEMFGNRQYYTASAF